jgi:hypothetical protein
MLDLHIAPLALQILRYQSTVALLRRGFAGNAIVIAAIIHGKRILQ